MTVPPLNDTYESVWNPKKQRMAMMDDIRKSAVNTQMSGKELKQIEENQANTPFELTPRTYLHVYQAQDVADHYRHQHQHQDIIDLIKLEHFHSTMSGCFMSAFRKTRFIIIDFLSGSYGEP